jgi:hypothetical protein
MTRGPKEAEGERFVMAFPGHSRVRADQVLRRKLIQKMVARRERRSALATAPFIRRGT